MTTTTPSEIRPLHAITDVFTAARLKISLISARARRDRDPSRIRAATLCGMVRVMRPGARASGWDSRMAVCGFFQIQVS